MNQLCEEFEHSHFAGLAENTVQGQRSYLKNLKAFFADCTLDKITVESVETYRDRRKRQPAKGSPKRKVNGVAVNRELECLKCVSDLALNRKYIRENPASAVKDFKELRVRSLRRMLTLDDGWRILEVAPPHLRAAIILPSQTGGRTYREGFSLRWDQVDFKSKVIRSDNDVKTPGSVERIPLSEYACEVPKTWKEEPGTGSRYVFPSPIFADRPISMVKTA